MVIKVLIRRLIKENKIGEVVELLKKLRVGAMNQSGYISGETLINQNDSQHLMVVSIWQTVEDWNRWQESDERKANDEKLERFLIAPAEYGVFDVVSTKLWSLI